MDVLFKILVTIAFILIRIGDAVRVVAKFISTVFTTIYRAIAHLVGLIKKTYDSRPIIPKKTITSLTRLYWSRFLRATGHVIAKISLPSLPSVRLTLRLPRITLPSQFIPKPKQHVSYTIYPTPLEIANKLKYFFGGVAFTVLFVLLPFTSLQWLRALPNPNLLSHRDIEVTTKILDRNGILLYEVYADQNRTPIPLSEIPQIVQQATVAIEDKEFWRHQGFSLSGIARATRETLLHHRLQGGSTITQQLIKSALLTPEITLERKLKELLLAFWAERLYTKQQILEMYLNQVPYGGTSWGIESASRTYFNKSVHDLTLGETAILAGLPQAPTEFSPFGANPQKAFDRQREVLRRMVEDRYITQEESDKALSEPITFNTPRVGIRAPHFVMYVKNILEKRYGTRLVERGGLRVTTSIDITIQEKLEEIVKTNIDKLSSLHVTNGSALVTHPKTGEIIAMVGSHDYFDVNNDGNVNVTTSLRQPGSSIKVVTYAASLEHGMTAASILDDAPVVYHVPGSPDYAPVNYDGKFHGPVPLRYALGNSYNIPAVKTLARLGLSTMIQKGRLMGITTWDEESRFGLSLTLGGGEVTMIDMAKVYGTLANSGTRMDITPILEVTDYTGRLYEKFQTKKGVEALTPEASWIIGNILSDNNARTNAFGPNSALVVPDKTVSVKTGTSNDKRDNWTIGYTPSYVSVVWVGNNDNSPMDPLLTSGITGASPIWHDIMVELLKEKPDEVAPKPETVLSIPCYFGRIEYFIKGTEPASGRCAALPTPQAAGQTPSPALTPTPLPQPTRRVAPPIRPRPRRGN